MTKPFIPYTSQIEKLQNEKNLIIEDTSFALEMLQNISYYALISGYKQPFINTRTRKYLPNTHFEDLLLLYIFDEELRSIFFKYLCKVERQLRSSISYHFCERHGELQAAYLDCHNYSTKPDYRNGIAKLLKILAYIANQSTDHKYIVYQRNKYHNIPLWVTINVLTFGQLSKMFEFFPQNMQASISKDFRYVQKNEMIKFLKVLTLYRNVCAHNERLFSFRTYIDIPDTLLHSKLQIVKKGSQYIHGKNDLFSVVIAFRYLLPQNEFLQFKKQLIRLFNWYENHSENLTAALLLSYMGFPENWKNITRVRII